MSIECRIRKLEQSLPATSHGELDRETWRAVLAWMIGDVEAMDLGRDIAALEDYGEARLPWLGGKVQLLADLPRMRAERDAIWRARITERFEADVAERFVKYGSD